MDSVSSVVGIEAVEPNGMLEGGRSASASEKAGDGNTVKDLTRMLVTVSGCRRCGLN